VPKLPVTEELKNGTRFTNWIYMLFIIATLFTGYDGKKPF
jgi:hypothetical protein